MVKMKYTFVPVLVSFFFMVCHEEIYNPPVYFAENSVFISGQSGYHTFRIPAIIETLSGHLLAFCEGRKNSQSDTGDIDIVMKRSIDNGDNWSPLEIVIENGIDTAGNPCPVVDRKTGIIWLPYTTNYGEDTEGEIISRTGKGSRSVWMTYSEDDGVTWAKPQCLDQMVKLENWTWYATGPGRGIQLKSGRLLIPCNHNVFNEGSHSHVIYSDDHGDTWELGGELMKGTDESQVAELDDGTVLINMRNMLPGLKRAVARSYDEGETWSETTFDQSLIEPICQGSLLNTKHGLLFTNPNSILVRKNLTVRLSMDGGLTWPVSKSIFTGLSAYSALSILSNSGLGCLYEKGEISLYESISFARFSIDWLED